jgi:hypothetical protein
MVCMLGGIPAAMAAQFVIDGIKASVGILGLAAGGVSRKPPPAACKAGARPVAIESGATGDAVRPRRRRNRL